MKRRPRASASGFLKITVTSHSAKRSKRALPCPRFRGFSLAFNVRSARSCSFDETFLLLQFDIPSPLALRKNVYVKHCFRDRVVFENHSALVAELTVPKKP